MRDDIMVKSLGQLVAEQPARARVFERFHLDFCCGGRKPLAQACAEKNLDPDEVALAVSECDRSGVVDWHGDWSKSPMSQLIDHIETRHHAHLKRELRRLTVAMEKLAQAEGAAHPELLKMCEVFAAFRAELEMHIKKEELILFPLCRSLEATPTLRSFHGGSLQSSIRAIIAEHDDSGHSLEQIRALSHDYTPPADASAAHRDLLLALSELEIDMHRHIHEENNILFPMALAAESLLQRAFAPEAAEAAETTSE
jgi:regulator of cell morphogenesis and NO signaling